MSGELDCECSIVDFLAATLLVERDRGVKGDLGPAQTIFGDISPLQTCR